MWETSISVCYPTTFIVKKMMYGNKSNKKNRHGSYFILVFHSNASIFKSRFEQHCRKHEHIVFDVSFTSGEINTVPTKKSCARARSTSTMLLPRGSQPSSLLHKKRQCGIVQLVTQSLMKVVKST